MDVKINMEEIKSTTVVAVIHNGIVAIGADGQATLGHTVAKNSVNKIRKLCDGEIIAGFAGATADAFTLLEKFEGHLTASSKQLKRAAVQLTKEWRTDKHLSRLEATIIAIKKGEILIITGLGELLEPENNVASIGSGSLYAQSAATALLKHAPHLSAEEIVRESLTVAADLCIYTNHNFQIHTIN